MSNNYCPDGWVLVQHPEQPDITRIFACWSGSYTYGDSWKLSSAIEDFEAGLRGKSAFIVCKCMSGSSYHLISNSEGRISAYNLGLLNKILQDYGYSAVSLDSFLEQRSTTRIGTRNEQL